MIDFETAVDFPADSDPANRLVSGFPFDAIKSEDYMRPRAPELREGMLYCPFRLDIWQFGQGFECFKVIITAARSLQTADELSDDNTRD